MGILITPSSANHGPLDIDELERLIGIRLPRDYATFLIDFGGGIPEDNISSADNRVSVSRFCDIGDNGSSVKRILESYKGRIPEHTIPIAEAAGGNLVLLRLPRGSVCFWDHEREAFDMPHPTGNEACTELALSFSEFIENLVPMSGSSVEDVKVISAKVDPGFAARFGLKQKT